MLISLATHLKTNYLSRYSHLKDSASNAFWLLVDRSLRILTVVLVGILVARYLGPDQYGKLSYTIAIISIFQTVVTLGIDNIAIRELSKNPKLTPLLIGNIFGLRLITSVLLVAFIYYITGFFLNSEIRYLVVTLSFILLVQPFEVIDLFFQSQLKSKYTVLAKGIAILTSSVLKVIFIINHSPLLYFIYASILEAFISAALLYSIYIKKYPYKWILNWTESRALLQEGSWYLIAGILLNLSLQMDKIMLEKLSDVFNVGIYSTASSLANLFNFLALIICSSFAPKLAKMSDNDLRVALFINLTSVLFYLSLGIAVITFYFSNNIILIFYGSQFSQSSDVLAILAFSIIPIFLSVINDYIFLTYKKGYLTLLRTLFGLLLNISLNLVLIPKYGVKGAAIASLLAHTLSNTIFQWIIFPKTLHVFIRALIKPFTPYS